MALRFNLIFKIYVKHTFEKGTTQHTYLQEFWRKKASKTKTQKSTKGHNKILTDTAV